MCWQSGHNWIWQLIFKRHVDEQLVFLQPKMSSGFYMMIWVA